jgi:hypothetical protein
MQTAPHNLRTTSPWASTLIIHGIRFLGALLDDFLDVPHVVAQTPLSGPRLLTAPRPFPYPNVALLLVAHTRCLAVLHQNIAGLLKAEGTSSTAIDPSRNPHGRSGILSPAACAGTDAAE